MNFKQRIDALLQAGKDIERPTDRCYVHVPSGTELQRCTNFLRGGEEFFMPKKWQGASLIGTDCDQVCRDFFVEDRTEMRSYEYKHMDQAAYNQLLEGLDKMDGMLSGWEVYADRVFLYSLELGVAGEVDLLLVNYQTEEVVIVDMKTVRSPQYMTPGSDKMKKYRKQLNVYRTMAEELMGGYKVKALYILPIHVAYPPYGTVTTKAQFLEWMEVPMYDPLPEIEALWVKNTGMTPAEHHKAEAEKANTFDAWLAELQSL